MTVAEFVVEVSLNTSARDLGSKLGGYRDVETTPLPGGINSLPF